MTDSLNPSLSKLAAAETGESVMEWRLIYLFSVILGALLPLLKLRFEEEVTSRERFLAPALSKCGV